METNNGQTKFVAELKIIPILAWVIAGLVFLAAQWFFNFAILHHLHPGHPVPPPLVRPFLGLLAGFFGAGYVLLIGYVCGDSRRRGMSSVLWTLIAICVPYAMGIFLYFILRQKRRESCPQCGNAVQPGFNFCPRCNYKLGMNCPQCQRAVGMNDIYCPYCGTTLRPQSAPGGTGQASPGTAS